MNAAPRIVVYTCIVGRITDELRLPVETAAQHCGDVDFVCFTDRARYGDAFGPWRVLPPAWSHPSVPRRTARWHKALPHRILPGYDVWVWCDGCFELRVPPRPFAVDALAHGPALATFRHHERDCVYREAEACKRLRKDDPAVLDAQAARYRDAGFPPRLGLVETTCVIRRDTPEVRAFDEAWWGEMAGGSLRDQVSFNYVAWRRGFAYHCIDGWRERNKYFNFYPHHEA